VKYVGDSKYEIKAKLQGEKERDIEQACSSRGEVAQAAAPPIRCGNGGSEGGGTGQTRRRGRG
jgi:hypothetical protein